MIANKQTFCYSHSFLKYPEESQLSLGLDRRGCFEPPSETTPPNRDVNCPDILPIEDKDNTTDYTALDDDSQIVHPDCPSGQRYVMGTRLQTRGAKGKSGKSAHKLESCKYHDLDCSKQGAKLKTLSQGKYKDACYLIVVDYVFHYHD